MGRRYSFAWRRQHPESFPYVCGTCLPQRRFERPEDFGKHNKMKHGQYSVTPIPRFDVGSTCDRFYGLSLGSRSASCGFTPRSPSPFRSFSFPSTPIDTKMTTSDFERFVRRELEPDSAYNASCSAVVDRLVKFLQNNVPEELRPQEVIKAGSLGKGTAVKNKSDADLIVFLADPKFNTIPKMALHMNDVLRTLRSYLGGYGECQITGQSQFAVKVRLSCHVGYDLDVDILPTCNILQANSKSAVYRALGESDKRDYYSAALVKLQKDFVERRPTKLKSLIRVIKYWRKTAFEERSDYKRLPSSYPLELITIGEWEDAGGPENFDLRKGFYKVLKALENYHRLRHVWNDNYSTFQSVSTPYVMDPANPYNNVMDASNAWDEVATRARQTISAGFGDLVGNVSTWR